MARFRPRRHAGRADADAADAAREPHPGWGTGTRLWLVRHGEVHEDWQGLAYGDLDVPLSAMGREQTERLTRRFGAERPDLVLSSPLQRALELGRALAAAHGLEPRVESDLREIHRGSWQGRRVAELHELDPESVEEFYADPWSWRGHGGESDELVWRRAWRVLERTLAPAADERVDSARSRPRTVLVASHYNVIRVVLAYALGVPPPRSFAIRVDPGRAALLVDGESGWVLRHSNVAGPAGSAEPNASAEPAETARGTPAAGAQGGAAEAEG